MIRKLRKKFILIAMLSLLAVFILVVGGINIVNFHTVNTSADEILQLLANNGGDFPEDMRGKGNKFGKMAESSAAADASSSAAETNPAASASSASADSAPAASAGSGDSADANTQSSQSTVGFSSLITAETPFSTRYFSVRADASGSVNQINTGHIAAISSSDAQTYAETAMASGKTRGYIGDYKYQVVRTSDSILVVFLDCQSQLSTAYSFLLTSTVISLVSMALVFVLVHFFSGRAIEPVIESMEKQKQFITNAGHELKTPLAIISANTEVLEMTEGENEWTKSIRNQIRRMTDLIQEMLTLSRMQEQQMALVFSRFQLSDAVWEVAMPFETLAEQNGKRLEINIQPDLLITADEKSIRQLVSILADNAVKYASPGGSVSISLRREGRTAVLEVANDVEEMPDKKDLEKLFDRFYRGDASHNQKSGGFGIGLSIAQEVVEAHKGKISVRGADGRIIFTVQLRDNISEGGNADGGSK